MKKQTSTVLALLALLATGTMSSINSASAQTTIIPTDVTGTFSGGRSASAILNNYGTNRRYSTSGAAFDNSLDFNGDGYSSYRSAFGNASDNLRSGAYVVGPKRGLLERMFDHDEDRFLVSPVTVTRQVIMAPACQ